VFAYLVSLCRDRTRAEDLMQDTFVRATRALPGYRGGSPRAWLFAIARSVFLDDYRRSRRYTAVDLDDRPVDDPDVSRTLSVRAALGALPEQQQTVLVLHDQLGLSHEEVASILGKSPGATRVLLHRARAAFRSVYTEEG
jgi:RNA polymerase sigma-70 factor (ECF subfamily)